MSDGMTRKRWLNATPGRRPAAGAGRVHGAGPKRRIGRPRLPLLDRGGMACLALAGGLIWLLAAESDPNAAPGSSGLKLGRHDSYVESLACAPDGRLLASCSLDRTVALWSVGGEGPSREIPGASLVATLPHPAGVCDAAFSPDGKLLATVGFDALAFWSCGPGPGEVVAQLRGEAYRCPAFAPDGTSLAVGCIDGSIQVLDMPGARSRYVIRAYRDKIARLAFSPNGRVLASTSMPGEVKLWDPLTGRELGHIDVAPGRFQALAFAPDGRSLALAQWLPNQGEILIWDLEAGRPRARLAGHIDGIGQLAFSRDGRFLVSGSRDRSVMFWDPETGARLATIRDAGGIVNALALTPDGLHLAFVAGDDTVRWRDLADLIPLRPRP
jgi:WD40 repeat protein